MRIKKNKHSTCYYESKLLLVHFYFVIWPGLLSLLYRLPESHTHCYILTLNNHCHAHTHTHAHSVGRNMKTALIGKRWGDSSRVERWTSVCFRRFTLFSVNQQSCAVAKQCVVHLQHLFDLQYVTWITFLVFLRMIFFLNEAL